MKRHADNRLLAWYTQTAFRISRNGSRRRNRRWRGGRMTRAGMMKTFGGKP